MRDRPCQCEISHWAGVLRGRNDKVIVRNDKVIGRNDKVIGRNDKVIGRNDKVIGRNDKSRTNRTMISHDLASARFRARSGKTEGQGS